MTISYFAPVVLVAALSAAVIMFVVNKRQSEDPRELTALLETTSVTIQKLNPEMSAKMLAVDSGVILRTFHIVRSGYREKSFSYVDTTSAVSEGWKNLRGGPSHIRLAEKSFLISSGWIDYMRGLGRVIVESVPPNADVTIDGTPTLEKTPHKTWLPENKYRVGLKLKGYEPVEDECVVTEARSVTFHKDLKPQP